MKRSERRTAPWISAALMVVPLRGGMVGMPGPDPEIAKVADAYAAAMLAGDASAAASLYAEDGVEMPPGKPPIRGRAAIEGYYRGLFAGCKFSEFVLTHTELRAAGDVGWAAGTSRSTLVPGGAAPVQDAGKYLVVLKHADGRWKVMYSIYNSDRPGAH